MRRIPLFKVWDKKIKCMGEVLSIDWTNGSVECIRESKRWSTSFTDSVLLLESRFKVKNGFIFDGVITKHQGKLYHWFLDDRNMQFSYLFIKTTDENAPFEQWDNQEIVGNQYQNPELFEHSKFYRVEDMIKEI